MTNHRLELIEVETLRKRVYSYPGYPRSDRFEKTAWWNDRVLGDDSSARWVSVLRDGEEVARCRFDLLDGPRTFGWLGPLSNGQLDVLLLEVAQVARRQGIGRATLNAIKELYPLRKMTALNDDATSRAFWDGIGWTRHEPRLPGGERATYSEP